MVLNEEWTVRVVAEMHRYRITGVQLAAECNNPYEDRYEKKGYSPAYLSQLLNGKKRFESEEAKENTKQVVMDALRRLGEKQEAEISE